jgi:hypothetical protein
MDCRKCKMLVSAELARYRIRSGAIFVGYACPNCNHFPSQKWLRQLKLEEMGINVNCLPLAMDTGDLECCVIGCQERGVEWHHFAPYYLFEDANDWPIQPLCRRHHLEWHRKITEAKVEIRGLEREG